MSPPLPERRIIFLVAAVQFINILDFMMVMPLGPDFARALGIDLSQLGYLGGAYTAAAAVAGIAGSFFLDRFDRRPALAVALFGLVAGTAAGGLATDLGTLMAARLVAGMFGGPATSLALAIIADVIPPERRGKALGAVMGAFAVSSVVGVPLALELARMGTWRTPFFTVGGLGLAIAAAAVFLLPPVKMHLERRAGGEAAPGLGEMLARPVVRWSYAMTACVMMSGFILIPNLSAYFQENLQYPRADLGRLYLVGGAASFVTLRIVGALVDRYGSFRTGTVASAALVAILYLGFIAPPPAMPVLALFVGFMLAMSSRNVAHNTLTTQVPRPAERARFMSIQSAVQHVASSAGAFLSARLLRELPDKRLDGIPLVAGISIALTALLPVLLWVVEARVRPGEHLAPLAPLP